MPITVIDKIKQKSGNFKLLDASDINWNTKIPVAQLPDNIATDEEMNQAIADAVAGIDQLHRVVIANGGTLPDVGKADTIYMLPETNPEAQNAYSEWMYVNNKWEKIGTSKVDLTNYPTTTQMNSAIGSAKTELKAYADTSESDAIKASKIYTDQEKAKYLPLTGGTVTGKITGLPEPSAPTDAANKAYVDAVVESTIPQGLLTEASFTTGTTKGTFKVKQKEVAIAGLNTMAYEDKSNYLTKDKLAWQTF